MANQNTQEQNDWVGFNSALLNENFTGNITQITSGSHTPHLNLARTGMGNGLWVDQEGISYLQRKGKFTPSRMIPSVFDKIPESDFNYVIGAAVAEYNLRKNEQDQSEIIVKNDSGELETIAVLSKDGLEILNSEYGIAIGNQGNSTQIGVLKRTNTCKFGVRDEIVVGEDGVLYFTKEINNQVIGHPRLPSHWRPAKPNETLEQRAYERAVQHANTQNQLPEEKTSASGGIKPSYNLVDSTQP